LCPQGWYLADNVFSRGPYPSRGAADSIFSSDYQAADDAQRLAGRDELFTTGEAFASSLRLVVDMADRDRLHAALSTGQSSTIGSQWHKQSALKDWSVSSLHKDALCVSAACKRGGSMRSQYCAEQNEASRFVGSGCLQAEKSEL
jgi:hypothetical protein